MSTAAGKNARSSGRPTVVSLDLLRLFAALLVVLYHYAFYVTVDHGAGGIAEQFCRPVSYPGLVPFA